VYQKYISFDKNRLGYILVDLFSQNSSGHTASYTQAGFDLITPQAEPIPLDHAARATFFRHFVCRHFISFILTIFSVTKKLQNPENAMYSGFSKIL
jgi:hypothetical protein